MRLLFLVGLFFSFNSWACYYDLSDVEVSCQQDWGASAIICGPDDYYTQPIFGCQYPSNECIPEAHGCCHYPGSAPAEYIKKCPAGARPSPPIPRISPNCFSTSIGSIIVKDSQVIQEKISVTGTRFDLVYSSDKVPGRSEWFQIDLPLTSAEFNPTSAPSVYLSLSIANKTTNLTLNGQPSLSYPFVWDGKDVNGVVQDGPRLLEVTAMEQYTFIPTNPVPLKYTLPLGSPFNNSFGLGGWSPSVLHVYDPLRKVLHLGDGSTYKSDFSPRLNGDKWVVSSDRNQIYVFNSSDKHIQTKHAVTGANLWSFSYNTNGKIATITDAYGEQTSIQYSGNIPTLITSPDGHVTAFTTDANGYLATITNPASETYSMTYSSKGLLLSFEKPSGVTSSMTYDSLGYLLTDSSSAGSESILEKILDGSNWVINETSASGRVSIGQIQNVNSGYIRTDISPSGFTSVRSEDVNGSSSYGYQGYSYEEFKAEDPRFGIFFKFVNGISEYNGWESKTVAIDESVTGTNPGDPFALTTLTTTRTEQGTYTTTDIYTASSKTNVKTSPLGRNLTTQINTQGDLTSIQLASFVPLTMTYGTDGRIASMAQGTSRTTTFNYSSTTGFLTSVQNPLSQVTSYTHDPIGRVLTQTLPDSRVITFKYDADGNLASVSPPSRPSHSMTYNGFGFLSDYLPPTISAPGNLNTTYTYNDDRQLMLITRPDLQTVTFDYHSTTGNLYAMTLPTGTRTFGYYADGNLSESASEDSVNRMYTYTGGTRFREDLYYGAFSFFVAKSLNFRNQTSQENLNLGADSFISFTYNNDGLLTNAGNEILTRVNSTGLVSQAQLGNVKTTFTYSTSYGELSNILAKYSTTNRYQEAVVRDDLGRITSKTETYSAGASNVYAYTYDTTGRLTLVTLNGLPFSSYSYDGNSNRTSQTIGGVTTAATYDDQDRLLTFGTKTFSYNKNGELTSVVNSSPASTTNFTYDVLGNLKSVAMPGKTINYKVDVHNRRVVKLQGTTLKFIYLWNVDNQLIGLANPNGTLNSRFVYGLDPHVPDYVIKGSTKYAIIKDHLGSPVMVINSSNGTISQQVSYDEWGNILSDTSPGFTPFGFAGCLYDIDTKLCRFGARDYDPSIGRWLSKDPIMFNGGDTNLYGYVLQDPVNFIDPDGTTGYAVGVDDWKRAYDNVKNTKKWTENIRKWAFCKINPAKCGTDPATDPFDTDPYTDPQEPQDPKGPNKPNGFFSPSGTNPNNPGGHFNPNGPRGCSI